MTLKHLWTQHARWLLGIFGPIAAGTACVVSGGPGWVFLAGLAGGVILGGLMLLKKI